MYCWKCGKEIDDDAVVCVHCGVTAKKQAEQVQQPVINVVNTNVNQNTTTYRHKSKWAAFWLCLFLGEFGVHRFYTGKIGTGLIWMFTGGFFLAGWLIDLVMILCGGFRDKAGQTLI